MRREDREIKNFNEIVDVLRRADTIRLGLNGDDYPYVAPLSFGYEASFDSASFDAASFDSASFDEPSIGAAPGMDTGGSVTIYFHGAHEGLKHDLIARDNRVCVEADIFHGYKETSGAAGRSVTAEYESVIGFGVAGVIAGAEAERAVGLMLEHCGYAGLEYNKAALSAAKIYKIVLSSITGKRNINTSVIQED